MINIAKLLKDAPKGMKLYSPLFGEVFLYTILSDSKFITVRTADSITTFNKFGQWGDNSRLERFPDAECLLFPSKEVRTWEGWKLPVESNFKVGDWIVKKDGTPFYGGNYAEQVTLIEGDGYLKHIWFSSGTWLRDKDISLWTIQDAKDGEVLATDNGWTCIFKLFDGYVFSSYCFMDSKKWFCEVGAEGHTLDSRINGKTHPATKEQRDLLFAKMKEAGYEWDEKKKELRKIIEPKFKVGDDIKTGNTIETIAEINYATRSYSCESGRTIWFENEDMWHLAPKPHYDISNFNPFDKVLVRQNDSSTWGVSFFGRFDGMFMCCTNVWFEQCIPFEGNEHLLGTTDMCDKQYINW